MPRSSNISDRQLAFAVLQREGLSREDAATALVNDPGAEQRLKPQIEKMRADLDAQFAQAEADAYASTPQGRAKAAEAALAAQEQRAKLVAGSKALLAEAGTPVDDLDDAHVLHVAGIEKRVDLMSHAEKDAAVETFAAQEWDNLTPVERSLRASELGVKTETVERYRADFLGRESDTASQGGEAS